MNQGVGIAGKYWIEKIVSFGSEAINFIFPNSCVVCGKTIDFKELLCTDCTEKIFNVFPIMSVSKKFKYLDRLWAFTKYEDIKELIIKYKFIPRMRLSKLLSIALYKVYSASPVLSTFRYVTFVPSTRGSRFEKGFDHTEKMVRDFSKISNTEILSFLKAKSKKPQIEFNKKDRSLNVVGKYQITRIDAMPERLILIDDIVTTGATIDECAKILKAIGIEEIHGLVVAYNF